MGEAEVAGRAEELSRMDAGAVVEIEMNLPSFSQSQRRANRTGQSGLTMRWASRNMSRKPKCVIITGQPGSGKTTLAKKLGERLWMPVISRDEIKEAISTP